jgi:hypothetical protein
VAGRVDHEERTRRLLRVLEEEAPPAGDPFPCPYLPDRVSRNITILARQLPAGLYHAFMDLNFRRMGRLFYRPDCEGCTECRMLRVPVGPVPPVALPTALPLPERGPRDRSRRASGR